MTKSICVIGAGLAGGIVASQLSKKGLKVTLVEYGKKIEPYESNNEDWELDSPKAAFTRGIGIGGTTNYWHGGLTALDLTDVDERSEYFGSKKIPVKYDEIRSYYSKAINLIRDNKDYSLEDVDSPVKNAQIPFDLNTDYFRYKGLIYPAKAFSTKKLVEEATNKYGLDVIRGYEVERLNFSDSNCVVSIEGFDHVNNEHKKIVADKFIICAGGLGSPKILLQSAKESEALSGLPIGKYIIDHPSGFVFKAKLRKRHDLKKLFGEAGKGYRVQNGFVLNPDKLELTDHRNHIVFMRPATSMKDPLAYDFLKRKLVGYKGKNLKISDIVYLFRHADLLFDVVNFKFGLFNKTKYVSGMTFIEQFPDDDNYISCNNDGGFSIRWRVSEKDGQSIEKFLKVFFDKHKDIFEDYIIFPDLHNRLESSGHHSGGCRMSDNSADGVVDSNLKVFGVDNLFVVDGSVLGYSGHANTGLTIAALALKCADYVQAI